MLAIVIKCDCKSISVKIVITVNLHTFTTLIEHYHPYTFDNKSVWSIVMPWRSSKTYTQTVTPTIYITHCNIIIRVHYKLKTEKKILTFKNNLAQHKSLSFLSFFLSYSLLLLSLSFYSSDHLLISGYITSKKDYWHQVLNIIWTFI